MFERFEPVRSGDGSGPVELFEGKVGAGANVQHGQQHQIAHRPIVDHYPIVRVDNLEQGRDMFPERHVPIFFPPDAGRFVRLGTSGASPGGYPPAPAGMVIADSQRPVHLVVDNQRNLSRRQRRRVRFGGMKKLGERPGQHPTVAVDCQTSTCQRLPRPNVSVLRGRGVVVHGDPVPPTGGQKPIGNRLSHTVGVHQLVPEHNPSNTIRGTLPAETGFLSPRLKRAAFWDLESRIHIEPVCPTMDRGRS